MLKLVVPDTRDYWDPAKEEFVRQPAITLSFEHSLISISKWEAKYHKAFLTREEKTGEEMLEYIKCMCITPNVPDEAFSRLTQEHIQQLSSYIEDPHTATVIRQQGGKRNRDVMTNEVIYYAMFANGIPKECEKWHLNRLITLINVFSVKNQPPKKMNKRDILRQNAKINEARLKKYNTKG